MITNHPNLNLAHSKSKKLNIVGNSKAIYLFRSNFVVVNAAERCFIKLSPPARLEPRLVVHADHVEVGSAFDREPWEGEEPHVQLRFKLERIKRLLEGSREWRERNARVRSLVGTQLGIVKALGWL